MNTVTDILYLTLKAVHITLEDAGHENLRDVVASALRAYEAHPVGYVEYTYNGKFYTGGVFETDEEAYMKAKRERMMNTQEEDEH